MFSAHIDNKKDILVLGIGSKQGLQHTLTAENPLIYSNKKEILFNFAL